MTINSNLIKFDPDNTATLTKMINENKISAESIVNNAMQVLLARRSYLDKETKNLLLKLVDSCQKKHIGTQEVTRNICYQLSLITGISYSSWVHELYPLNITSSSTTEICSKLSLYLPREIKADIDDYNVALLGPMSSYNSIRQVEFKFDIENEIEKWGVLGEFARSGCIYSMICLGNLLCPLVESDPVIGINKDAASQFLGYAFFEISENKDAKEYQDFEARFNTILCESMLKRGEILLNSENSKNEGGKLIKEAWRKSPNYSRTKTYINNHFKELLP